MFLGRTLSPVNQASCNASCSTTAPSTTSPFQTCELVRVRPQRHFLLMQSRGSQTQCGRHLVLELLDESREFLSLVLRMCWNLFTVLCPAFRRETCVVQAGRRLPTAASTLESHLHICLELSTASHEVDHIASLAVFSPASFRRTVRIVAVANMSADPP